MIHPPHVLAYLETLIDRSAGPDRCHPWRGPVHRRGTPFVYVPGGGELTVAPRRVLFEEFHSVKLDRAHRVSSRCDGLLCCNPAHLWGGDLALRLHSLLDKSGGPDACWPYLGVLFKGYGRMGVKRGERYFAHRIAYEVEHGMILGHQAHSDDEKLVMHTCDNPPCCNPKHLRLGTDVDNIHDMLAKGRAGWQQKRLASGRSATWPIQAAPGEAKR